MEVIKEKTIENEGKRLVKIRHFKRKFIFYYIYKWYWERKGFTISEVEYGRR